VLPHFPVPCRLAGGPRAQTVCALRPAGLASAGDDARTREFLPFLLSLGTKSSQPLVPSSATSLDCFEQEDAEILWLIPSVSSVRFCSISPRFPTARTKEKWSESRYLASYTCRNVTGFLSWNPGTLSACRSCSTRAEVRFEILRPFLTMGARSDIAEELGGLLTALRGA